MDETTPQQVESGSQKPCIACRELIPVDATVCFRCHQSQVSEKSVSFKKIIGWAAGITALTGLFASLFGGVKWIENHWTQHSNIRVELMIAQNQAERGEYEAAVATYQDILKKDSGNQLAADGQVTATMRWVENFSVLTPEGQSATDLAALKIDILLPILDSDLARAKGKRAADILAHIGWVHWLNRHIAEREFGPTAEQSFLSALNIDPSNVYAHAMLGNWLLQTKRSLTEAIRHFAVAVQTGKERPWVRTMQIGGLIYNDAPHARVELVKVVNDMRKNNESASEDNKQRILSFIYDLSPSYVAEFSEALSAIPPEDSWALYQWLDDQQETDASAIKSQQLRRDYIYANILERLHKQPEALTQYRLLETRLKGSGYSLIGPVENAIKRLTAK